MFGPVSRSSDGAVGVEVEIVGDEAALAGILHQALDDRVAASDDFEYVAVVELRANIIPQRGEMREVREQIDFGDGGAGLADASGGRRGDWRSSAKMRFSISMQRSCAVRIWFRSPLVRAW